MKKISTIFIFAILLTNPLRADHIHFWTSTQRLIDTTNLENSVLLYLINLGINPKTDLRKPLCLSAIDDPKWERAIPLIVAGTILLPFPPTRKFGIMLITMGIEYLGWEYYNHVWDYLDDLNLSFDKTLIQKPE
ncbi:MAG: hypothetical protein FJZ56_02180 [Chlamydiae bacterium]|nr:hypothetical protein [Chlamydiota bacterium]